jgi:hypothetical protein
MNTFCKLGIIFICAIVVKSNAQNPEIIFSKKSDYFNQGSYSFRGNFILTEDFNNDGIKDQCLANFNSSSLRVQFIFYKVLLLFHIIRKFNLLRLWVMRVIIGVK